MFEKWAQNGKYISWEWSEAQTLYLQYIFVLEMSSVMNIRLIFVQLEAILLNLIKNLF